MSSKKTAKRVNPQLRESYKDELYKYADSLTEDFFNDLMGIRLKLPLISVDKLYDKVLGARKNFNDVFESKRIDDVLDEIYDINFNTYYQLYPSLTAFEELINNVKGIYDFNDNIRPDDQYFKTNFKYWSLLVNKLRELFVEYYNKEYKFTDYLIPELSNLIIQYIEPKIEPFFPIQSFYGSDKARNYGIIECESKKYLCDQKLNTIYAEKIGDNYVPAEKAVLGMKIENKPEKEILEDLQKMDSENEDSEDDDGENKDEDIREINESLSSEKDIAEDISADPVET